MGCDVSRDGWRREVVLGGVPRLLSGAARLQEAMQNSPVANLKQSLAKMQAGDYDVDAVSARLNGLISDTPAVMFSFST